jgi:glycosyltransferase involved in cell wall biosynthesis
LLKKYKVDLIWLEYEALPWLPDFFENFISDNKTPLVVDYDDAIFHRYDAHKNSIVRWTFGKKISSIMRRADLVIAGNRYIQEYALAIGSTQVELLPSVVDTNRYQNRPSDNGVPTSIGWVGSPATAPNLQFLEPVIREIAKTRNVDFIALGANPSQLEGMPIRSISWSEENEVEQISKFDIGIMPLPDELFERGKCGYKLIQCMACFKPVVASPVGVNSEIVRDGVNGFLAMTHAEWITSLTRLIDDPSLRLRMGEAARNLVESQFSLQVTAPKLEQLLRRVANQ